MAAITRQKKTESNLIKAKRLAEHVKGGKPLIKINIDDKLMRLVMR